MSKLSIYDNSWINMVFEGKNKEYGAYQLRQQSDKTTVIAFFSGLIFISSIACIYLVSSLLGFTKPALIVPDELIDKVVHVTNIFPNRPPENRKTVVPIKQKTANTTEKQLTNPVIVTPDGADQNLAKNNNNTPKPTDGAQQAGTVTGQNPMSGNNGSGEEIPSEPDKPTLPVLLDKLPEFPGGIERFYSYVGKNFNNPDTDEPKTLRIYVAFVIEKDGSMTDIEVKRDPGYGLGKEAIRVLKSLRIKWEPGMIKGKPVRTAYNLPITVKVE